MRKYGFVAAGGGDFYSKRLKQLSVGDPVFVHDKGNGYIGYGLVTSEAQLAAEFKTPDGLLFDQDLAEPKMKRIDEPEDAAEWAVGIDWKVMLDRSEGKWFKGAFANQNIVCKLRDESTVDFLLNEFNVENSSA